MTEINDELAEWFEEVQKLSPECHLLCAKLSNEDGENYRILDDPEAQISPEEKKKRIEDGDRRVEITYWNSLIFGFDKKAAGKWLDEFQTRLTDCLRHCPDCALHWHMKRRAQLRKFSELVHHKTSGRLQVNTQQTVE